MSKIFEIILAVILSLILNAIPSSTKNLVRGFGSVIAEAPAVVSMERE